ncbi:hypothetical protein GJ698_06520 [Pseudoduganella sp. FT26W]|uniref:Uncharacterized protein n=1 Tax=Duganella aquatilis TaxID=2666082 RepID=A0A844CSL3_9BURK|nr:hypothetical protein [Duganella aquatilis]MRW83747.1 hypothetical protein [Duganella aquatilis]
MSVSEVLGHGQAADGRVQFQWRNCFGDVTATRFGLVIKEYWSKVARPALISAEAEVEHWASSDEGGACFVHSDRLDQRAITAAAMCLSIQSIWERQLRQYLVTCVCRDDRQAEMQGQIHHAHWKNKKAEKKRPDLQELFRDLRGVPMSAFLSFPQIDLLAELGNACRHGDGKAVTGLWQRHPELWPAYCRESLLALDGTRTERTVAPPFADMNIEPAMLEGFVDSIADFWEMVQYLYHESLTSKHWTLEKRLLEDRRKLARAISHFNNVAYIRSV